MLTPYLPYPPASGGQIRTLNLLKYLSKKNEITLVCLYKNATEKKYAKFLSPFCKEIVLCKRAEKPWQLKLILKSIFSFLPFLIVRNFSGEAKKIIADLVTNQPFDVIHAETFYIMPHLPSNISIPVFLVEQTIEYKVYQHFVRSLPIYLAPLFYFDILKLKYWEKKYWKRASLVAAVSESDRAIIQSNDNSVKTTVVPNGAGDEMFLKTFVDKNISPVRLLFVGNFFWLQNIEAAEYIIEKIYPELIKHNIHFKIIIAGQETKRKVAKESYEYIEFVDIHQNDSDLVRKLYENATVFIAPIFGPGGTRLKILAAMAAGLPVISTRTGIEGLEVKDDTHVLLASNENEFVQRIQLLSSDKNIYDTLRKNAYILAKEKYSWKSLAERMEELYQTII